MSYNCSKCQSENTQKFSIIYRNGTSNVALTSVGVGGVAGVGAGGGVSATSGNTQSHLANRCAPPEKMGVLGTAFGLFVLGLIIAIFVGVAAFWVGSLLATAYIFAALDHNKSKYPVYYKQWDAKFLCLRCEHEFSVEDV